MAKTRYREILELGASDMQKLMPRSQRSVFWRFRRWLSAILGIAFIFGVMAMAVILFLLLITAPYWIVAGGVVWAAKILSGS